MIKNIKFIMFKLIMIKVTNMKNLKVIMIKKIKLMKQKKIKVMMIQVKATTETFLWQLEGSATITYGNGEQVIQG